MRALRYVNALMTPGLHASLCRQVRGGVGIARRHIQIEADGSLSNIEVLFRRSERVEGLLETGKQAVLQKNTLHTKGGFEHLRRG
jgi:hypothetical protein